MRIICNGCGACAPARWSPAPTGTDGGGVYDVADVGSAGIALRATSEVTHEPRLAPALTVACALTKGDRPELVVQKLTELGVDTIVLRARGALGGQVGRIRARPRQRRVCARSRGKPARSAGGRACR